MANTGIAEPSLTSSNGPSFAMRPDVCTARSRSAWKGEMSASGLARVADRGG